MRDWKFNHIDFSTYPFYYEDRHGLRYIASPVRKIYRRINLDDLGKALIKTLNYQIKSSNGKIYKKFITIAKCKYSSQTGMSDEYEEVNDDSNVL